MAGRSHLIGTFHYLTIFGFHLLDNSCMDLDLESCVSILAILWQSTTFPALDASNYWTCRRSDCTVSLDIPSVPCTLPLPWPQALIVCNASPRIPTVIVFCRPVQLHAAWPLLWPSITTIGMVSALQMFLLHLAFSVKHLTLEWEYHVPPIAYLYPGSVQSWLHHHWPGQSKLLRLWGSLQLSPPFMS